jgi:hypothetical protein
MSVVYQRGQELSESDLRIQFNDANGDPITTLEVRYSIYFDHDGEWLSLGDTAYHTTPTASETDGKYWIDWMVPTGAAIGTYQVRWDYREDDEHMWKQSRTNFSVIRYRTTSPVRTAEVSDLADTPIVIVR